MNLPIFQTGTFSLHSGSDTWWRINAEGLTDDDLRFFAGKILHMPWIAQGFDRVIGIDRGGLRLGDMIREMTIGINRANTQLHRTLIVDDVLTTGASMEAAKKECKGTIVGAVMICRSDPSTYEWHCPHWVHPVLTIRECR